MSGTVRRTARAAVLLLIACALLGALSVPASAKARPAQAPPADFFGTQDWTIPSPDDLAEMHAGGLGTFRVNLLWAAIEPFPGRRDWGPSDQLFADAANNGVTLLPVILGSPAFAAADVHDPPMTGEGRQALQMFVADAVRRYGPNGTFWADHPELPARPVHAWEVWNEPNYPAFWMKAPSARQYASLLWDCSAAIRATDPTAAVVLGGLSNSKRGLSIVKYLKTLYRVPGAKRSFDVLAIHPYARRVQDVVDILGKTRAAMRAAGDGHTPIWITELGWSTAGPRSALTTSLDGQAARTRAIVRDLLAARTRLGLGKVIWFSWRDRPLDAGERDWWGPHTGFKTADERAKPVWLALQASARAAAQASALRRST